MVIRKTLKDNLKAEGFQVLEAEDGLQGLQTALKEKPDLILLDVKLPKMTGFQVCEEIRKTDLWTPILMLTAKSDEVDKVAGLKAGADDYVTKPFSMQELLARIKALFRRAEIGKTQTPSFTEYHFDHIQIFFDKLEVHQENKISRLTKREMDVLHYLIQRKGSVVSRDELLEQVWGYDMMITTRTVDNHIARLRKVLEKDREKPVYIVSFRSAGYQFTK